MIGLEQMQAILWDNLVIQQTQVMMLCSSSYQTQDQGRVRNSPGLALQTLKAKHVRVIKALLDNHFSGLLHWQKTASFDNWETSSEGSNNMSALDSTNLTSFACS